MQLTLWTYEGPPHVGAMRVAASMRGVHYVLHAPQGDTYADLLFTMIERRDSRPPVTYTTFQARDLGGDTAELFKRAAAQAYERFKPEVMLVGSSCTAELIQDDPGGLAKALGLPIPVVPLELPAYQKKENWGASETFYQLVRTLAGPKAPPPGFERAYVAGARPSCNLLGPTALGFRHRDDVREISALLDSLGVDVQVTAPLGASPSDIAHLGEADFNIVLYPEVAATAAAWLKRNFRQPTVTTVPIGVNATRTFIAEVCAAAGLDRPPHDGSPSPLAGEGSHHRRVGEGDDPSANSESEDSSSPSPGFGPSDLAALSRQGRGHLPAEERPEESRLPWYSRSVDSTYLTGKRVFIFADASHALAAARIATEELGFTLAGLGTYSREFAREVRAAAQVHGLEALITDDYLEVEQAIVAAQPELVLGTQMERHIAKRLGIACAVISAPVHVQDFPARYSPQMGFEGANVIFDTWVHPLVMGLEEHLLTLFRDDPEFHDEARPSHLAAEEARPQAAEPAAALAWDAAAETELRKVPFFVRGKARRNTETYARDHSLTTISVETLYDAKAHFGR